MLADLSSVSSMLNSLCERSLLASGCFRVFSLLAQVLAASYSTPPPFSPLAKRKSFCQFAAVTSVGILVWLKKNYSAFRSIFVSALPKAANWLIDT